MRECHSPQNWAHCPRYVPILVGVNVNMFGCPGTALRMNSSSGTKNSCITSREIA